MEDGLEKQSVNPTTAADQINNRPLTAGERYVAAPIMAILLGENTNAGADHFLDAVGRGDKASAVFWGLGTAAQGLFSAGFADIAFGSRIGNWLQSKTGEKN